MHTLTLPLQTTPDENYSINRRFHAIAHIHNVLVKHAKDLMKKLSRNEQYQTLRKEYVELLKAKSFTKGISQEQRARMKDLSFQMSGVRDKLGLTEKGLQSYSKVCAKQLNKLVSSQQAQKEATRVWKGVDAVLFGNGKTIHFKRFFDFNTICGTTNINGAKFSRQTMDIEWIGLHLKCKLPKKAAELEYVYQSLDNKVKYCEIKRRMFNNGWHYYLTVYLDGDAPQRLVAGEGTIGIDPGVSNIAGVSDTKLVLQELAPRVKEYEKKIDKLNQYMEHSRRLSNPNKFNKDGTIKKSNKDKWVLSNGYFAARRKRKTLYRKCAAYRKQSHEELANKILVDSKNIIIEDMNYSALAKRAKETKRKNVAEAVTKKDGTSKQVYKYKRKKRFGRSINSRAPAECMEIIKKKCVQYGGTFVTVNTQAFKASQYDHVADEYHKVPLSQREKVIGGFKVQRDLYSAFLIKNTASDFKHADREKCLYEFVAFVMRQNKLLDEMKQNNVTMKQCFGF